MKTPRRNLERKQGDFVPRGRKAKQPLCPAEHAAFVRHKKVLLYVYVGRGLPKYLYGGLRTPKDVSIPSSQFDGNVIAARLMTFSTAPVLLSYASGRTMTFRHEAGKTAPLFWVRPHPTLSLPQAWDSILRRKRRRQSGTRGWRRGSLSARCL
jgi:hypothetical protein